MTTMAALLGGLPLALGAGTGSELRRPLGIAIVGGLVFSQMLTLYTTPVTYLYMERCRLYFSRLRQARRQRLAAESVQEATMKLHLKQIGDEIQKKLFYLAIPGALLLI